MKILVTSALPYANGPIHIGHLVEYIQTDIFVRFLKLSGEDVIYCCADDTHGTPIEINASQLGISPEALIQKYYNEHYEAFKTFFVNFDNFYTTNSKENKEFSDYFFTKLKDNGDIYKKDVELTYCPNCKRFLPDRYVRGICPKCKSADQYGDNCEKCNTTYDPTELLEPKCSICNATPIRKSSGHYFFKLSNYSDRLQSWLEKNDSLQKEVKNYLLSWIKEGLKDWDITRDAPYFGFKIVGEEDKYYYVWLDAPIGYIASCKNYCLKNGISYEDYWKSNNSKIIHFIGKDIIYFHFLFWPAMLMGVGFNLPENIVVHGFLTINNEKMSKSRGTFITAKECADKLNPEYLRYFYATTLSHSLKDINLDTDDLKSRINSELADNFGNLTNRCLTFLFKNFGGTLSQFSYPELENEILELATKVIQHYKNLEFHLAIRTIMEIGIIGNKFFQDSAPWALIKTDKDKAQALLSFTTNVIKIMGTLLKPILPETINKLEKILNIERGFTIADDINFNLKNHTINKPSILLSKLEDVKLVEQHPSGNLLLKAGKILTVSDHPNADKLYILEVDFDTEVRQIVSGIKDHYSKEALIGKTSVFVYNLTKAEIRGVASSGMILAAKSEGNLGIILTDAPKGSVIEIEGVKFNGKTNLLIKEFSKMTFSSKKGEVFCEDKKLIAKDSKIYPDKDIEGVVG